MSKKLLTQFEVVNQANPEIGQQWVTKGDGISIFGYIKNNLFTNIREVRPFLSDKLNF